LRESVGLWLWVTHAHVLVLTGKEGGSLLVLLRRRLRCLRLGWLDWSSHPSPISISSADLPLPPPRPVWPAVSCSFSGCLLSAAACSSGHHWGPGPKLLRAGMHVWTSMQFTAACGPKLLDHSIRQQHMRATTHSLPRRVCRGSIAMETGQQAAGE